jgi:alkylhydroperoxidase/carboxymuconolactone decarboxylase family protein YurZ
MSTQDVAESLRKTIGMGAAKPETVLEYWQGVLEDFPELVADIQLFREAITTIGADDSGWRILTAIACSILNRQFEETHVLYMVDDDGSFGAVVYDAPEKIRGVALGMLSR